LGGGNLIPSIALRIAKGLTLQQLIDQEDTKLDRKESDQTIAGYPGKVVEVDIDVDYQVLHVYQKVVVHPETRVGIELVFTAQKRNFEEDFKKVKYYLDSLRFL
jgi:hypothetical protein